MQHMITIMADTYYKHGKPMVVVLHAVVLYLHYATKLGNVKCALINSKSSEYHV